MAGAKCPVCGEAPGGEVRVCPRCQTPHHPDCWEYVPGCAIFACADQGASDLSGWPMAYRLASLQAQAITLGTTLVFFGLPTSIALLATLANPRLLPVRSGLAVLGLGALILVAGLLLGLALRFHPEWKAALAASTEQGDRRLRRALAERQGTPLSLSPWELTAVTGMLIPIGILFDSLITDPLGIHWQWRFLTPFLKGAAVWSLVIFYPVALALSRISGASRVWLHRLDASEARAAPAKKPAPEDAP